MLYGRIAVLSLFEKYALTVRSLFYPSQPGQPDPVELQRKQQAKKKALAKKRAQEQLKPRTPEPVEGRKHVDVQTGKWLCHWHCASLSCLCLVIFNKPSCYLCICCNLQSFPITQQRCPFLKKIHRLYIIIVLDIARSGNQG